ncbi:glycosyltransferase family 2 protein [Litorisediminicola beolgyonensis]|uniref:Glycosyltransferase family 2 protein n=1 Tax=Litorisediminicola beolgyonensis TaxID=1173614 RepID=A0ABW3ZLZ7_9RHOB
MSETRPTYPGGISAVLAQMEGRRDPITYGPGEALAPLDTDLAALRGCIVSEPADDPDEAPPFRSAYHRKRFELRREFTGGAELGFLHGLVVAHLRKRSFPDHAPALFQRLWAEEADTLLEGLDSRWLVSAITTFGDHGMTPVQRSVGLALSTLFGTMKLYETERLFSGRPPEKVFPLDNKTRGQLALEMDPYSLVGGGLDVNMLGRLWQEAEGDSVVAPLAHRLLDLLIHDPRTVFRRLAVMKTRRERRAKQEIEATGTSTEKPPKREMIVPVPAARVPASARVLRWGLVSMLRGPAPAIARFAAHHLELGAAVLDLHLDEPNPEAEAMLARDPRVRVTVTDTGWWQAQGKERMEEHQLRQAWLATRSLAAQESTVDFLGHIDLDEFLLPDRPVADVLMALPPTLAWGRVMPVELLAPAPGHPMRHFKTTHREAGQRKSVVQEIYPTFGLHLYGGYLSHTSGKIFARTGLGPVRLGIHALKSGPEVVTNGTKLDGLKLAHLHAPSWETFRDHFAFRRARGSYRKRDSDPEKMGLADLLAFLDEEEGEDGLRLFFDEVCSDTAELRERLASFGMLIERPLDLDGAVARVFGGLAA